MSGGVGSALTRQKENPLTAVQAGRQFKLLQTNSLAEDEMCMATPAIAGDKLIIRTAERIYCLQRGAEFAEEKKAAVN